MYIIVIKSIDKVKMHQHDKLNQKYVFITLMGFHRKIVTTVLGFFYWVYKVYDMYYIPYFLE